MVLIDITIHGERTFLLRDLTIEELDNIKKSLYFAGWYNYLSSSAILKSIRTTYHDLVTAIENRETHIEGVLVDTDSKISEP